MEWVPQDHGSKNGCLRIMNFSNGCHRIMNFSNGCHRIMPQIRMGARGSWFDSVGVSGSLLSKMGATIMTRMSTPGSLRIKWVLQDHWVSKWVFRDHPPFIMGVSGSCLQISSTINNLIMNLHALGAFSPICTTYPYHRCCLRASAAEESGCRVRPSLPPL